MPRFIFSNQNNSAMAAIYAVIILTFHADMGPITKLDYNYNYTCCKTLDYNYNYANTKTYYHNYNYTLIYFSITITIIFFNYDYELYGIYITIS